MDSQGNKNLRDDIYPTYQPQYQEVPELPSYKIQNKLRLKKNSKDVLPGLIDEFRRRYDSEVKCVDQHNIIVIGYPADNDERKHNQNVLKIVQQYDSNARLVSSARIDM